MKILKNAFGFSVVQALIIGAVVAASGLVGTRLLVNSKLASKGAETRYKIEQVYSSIYTHFQSAPDCSRTMVGYETQLEGLEAFELDEVLNADAVAVFRVEGLYANNTISLDAINVSEPGEAELAGIRRVTINLSRLNPNNDGKVGQGFGAKNFSRSFPIRVVKDASGDFSSCYALEELNQFDGNLSSENDIAKELCEELAGSAGLGPKLFVWSDENSRCETREAACPTGELYIGFNASGEVQCQKIEDWWDLTPVLGPTGGSCLAGEKAQLKIVGNTVRIQCGADPESCEYKTACTLLWVEPKGSYAGAVKVNWGFPNSSGPGADGLYWSSDDWTPDPGMCNPWVDCPNDVCWHAYCIDFAISSACVSPEEGALYWVPTSINNPWTDAKQAACDASEYCNPSAPDPAGAQCRCQNSGGTWDSGTNLCNCGDPAARLNPLTNQCCPPETLFDMMAGACI